MSWQKKLASQVLSDGTFLQMASAAYHFCQTLWDGQMQQERGSPLDNLDHAIQGSKLQLELDPKANWQPTLLMAQRGNMYPFRNTYNLPVPLQHVLSKASWYGFFSFKKYILDTFYYVCKCFIVKLNFILSKEHYSLLLGT